MNTYAIDVIDVGTVLYLHTDVIHVILDFAHGGENAVQIDDAGGHTHVNWFAQIQQICRCFGEECRQHFVFVLGQQILQIVTRLTKLLNQCNCTFDADDAAQEPVGQFWIAQIRLNLRIHTELKFY